MPFANLGLDERLVRAVREQGYSQPTPIQEQAIPHVLAGRDLLGIAQTGTGKTAAFALPMIQRLAAEQLHGAGHRQGHRRIRALILSPTRELAAQIAQSFHDYGRFAGLRHTVIFGGVGQNPQVDALRRGVDILVATPGRLLDLMGQGFVRLDGVETFVLDEADQMLDMGFIHDVKRIIAALPPKRQNLLFSATMPTDIARLADGLLHDRAVAQVAPQATVAERITQRLFFAEHADKRALLVELLRDGIVGVHLDRALVFTRTKHGANKLAKGLVAAGIHAEAIHGNKSQSARTAALKGFKDGRVRVLVATDIAARGLDIDALSFVVNYDLSDVAETFVHRIGRTARAGASGIAIAFCAADEAENWAAIERLLGTQIERVVEHRYHSARAEAEAEKFAERMQKRGGSAPRPQGRSQGRGQGHGKGHGQGRERVQGHGHGQGQGRERVQGQGEGQGHGRGQGQGHGRGQPQGRGHGHGHGQGHGQGHGRGGDGGHRPR